MLNIKNISSAFNVIIPDLLFSSLFYMNFGLICNILLQTHKIINIKIIYQEL